jgi:hypothetical protein
MKIAQTAVPTEIYGSTGLLVSERLQRPATTGTDLRW